MEDSLFTFQPIDFVIILATGLILVVGLSLIALRRRNEILRDYLTPEEKDIEERFFRRRAAKPVVEQKKKAKSDALEEDAPSENEVSSEWGTPGDAAP